MEMQRFNCMITHMIDFNKDISNNESHIHLCSHCKATSIDFDLRKICKARLSYIIRRAASYHLKYLFLRRCSLKASFLLLKLQKGNVDEEFAVQAILEAVCVISESMFAMFSR